MIQLTEQDIKYLVKECVNRLMLNESQESDSQHKAMALAMQHGMNKEEANEFVRITLRNDMPSLRDKNGGKFTFGVARMFFDGELPIKGSDEANLLNQILKSISFKYYNEYDKNLNGLSVNELIKKYKSVIDDELEQDKQEISNIDFQSDNNYKIVPINSYEEAQQYYKYFEGRSESGIWCITHREENYDDYTCNGINQIYFCLRNGFENVEPVRGENYPLDNYGLSMISVIVNENGSLAYCTCRWNHDNFANDNILTTKQISEIVGVNFYNVFKPSHNWQNALNRAKQRLANGENPKEVFEWIENFNNGFAIVLLNDKNNFIDAKGNFLSNQWFDAVEEFYNGFAIVKKINNLYPTDYKWNFIDTEGNILYGNPNDINTWFDEVSEFENGYAGVRLNIKGWNLINNKGRLISKKWFDEICYFNNGYAEAELNYITYYIDTEGNLYDENKNRIG